VNDASSSSSIPGVAFTCDTLFITGCGVFFEGTGAEMHGAFEQLAALPDTTYIGHEYTVYKGSISALPFLLISLGK
jgi:hydroxyacylglutathione hydrolase